MAGACVVTSDRLEVIERLMTRIADVMGLAGSGPEAAHLAGVERAAPRTADRELGEQRSSRSGRSRRRGDAAGSTRRWSDAVLTELPAPVVAHPIGRPRGLQDRPDTRRLDALLAQPVQHLGP